MSDERMLVIVAPYFGTLPAHTQLWLNSCGKNPQVTWLLYTDDRTGWDYPGNVKVTYCTLDDLRERFQEKFDFRIELPDTKKLGDYKPLYGYLFDEEVKGYRAWGHVDVGDVIYGDFSKFITNDLINRYDRLGRLGHLTIYRNTPENNCRFMAGSDAGFGFREIFSSPEFMNFEEVAPGSIDAIWQHNGWTTGEIDGDVADLRAYSWDFRITHGYGTDHHKVCRNRDLVFEWADGRLYGHEISADGDVASREYLYVHFKRRKMPVSEELDESRYLIAPGGFLPARENINPSVLKSLGKRKFPDPMWISAKRAALRTRLKRVSH